MRSETTDPLQEQHRITQAIGSHILSHEKYVGLEWDAISVVVTIQNTGSSSTGYIYNGERWEARTPSGRAFRAICQELQAAMTPPGAEPWKQALIHITNPGPKINIKFEYDDPTRWSLKKVSLDMADYAESLRPPRD